MNQLQSEITQLEANPTPNQAELDSKRKKLKELEQKEKVLTKSLPIDTQITILQKEIQELSNKSNKTQTEQALLTSKKKELAELLKRQNSSTNNTAKPSNKTAPYVGGGIIGIVLILGVFILVRKHKKEKR